VFFCPSGLHRRLTQEEAEALDVRIEQARQEIRANNAILDGIERELYALRRRLRDREQ
jgi:hypothetical protein